MSSSQEVKTNLSIKYDVIVIGTGIVGCAIARQFTLEGASVLALEKGTDILDGASKGNSAILHTGFDAPPDSVEHSCIVSGYEEYLNIREKLKLPLMKTGALVTAWNQTEEDLLPGILEKAHVNGVADAKIITANETRTIESELSSNVKASIYVPREYVIDPWTAPFVYMLQAIENGAKLLRNAEVTSAEYDGEDWSVTTSLGNVSGKVVINCAGLYGDKVDEMFVQTSPFEIRPRKGQFLVYDKAASLLIKSIILPVPNEITKGVVVCRTAFGNVLVGPTAEEQESRNDASVSTKELLALKAKGEEIIPALAELPITATYAGIRPATQYKDYCIKEYEDKSYISVGGIRSTGLSGALGIAHYVYNKYQDFGKKHTSLPKIDYPSVSALAQNEERDWQKKDNEGIVCHCELVTQREIKQALVGDMAAGSLEGLKRRTRVTMGRCQGFYCSAKLSELTKGCFKESIAVSTKQGHDND